MSDPKSPADWIKDWEALTRQYFNAWSDFAPKSGFATAPAAASFGIPGMPGAGPFNGFGAMPQAGMPPGFAMPPGWQEGLEMLSRQFAGGGAQTGTAERAIESAKSYMTMLQSMVAAAQFQSSGFGAAPTHPAQAWFDALRGGSGASPQMRFGNVDASLFNNPFANALRDISAQGAKGFTELPAAFAPIIEEMRAEGLSWLRIPAFGIGREQQEHYQKTALAFAEFGQALQNYNALMLKAGQRGFELFEIKLADRDPGRSIDSLRALYDLWVDAAEEAYAQIALTEEFGKVYGELANAQMRAKAQVQAQVERVGNDLGMPTRSELNSIHKRLHELRREVRERHDLSGDISGIKDQIAALRAEVDALNLSVGKELRAPKEAPAAKTAPALKRSRPRPSRPARPSVPKPSSASADAEAPKAMPRPATSQKTPASAKRLRRRVRKIRSPAPRLPPPVVRPQPIAASDDKVSRRESSFGDAIAAMRRRIVGPTAKIKAVAAGMSKPSKQKNLERGGKKSKKQKK